MSSENGTRASFVQATQDDAIETARVLAQRDRVPLVIHGQDGQSRLCDSYGDDPFPPRG